MNNEFIEEIDECLKNLEDFKNNDKFLIENLKHVKKEIEKLAKYLAVKYFKDTVVITIKNSHTQIKGLSMFDKPSIKTEIPKKRFSFSKKN